MFQLRIVRQDGRDYVNDILVRKNYKKWKPEVVVDM